MKEVNLLAGKGHACYLVAQKTHREGVVTFREKIWKETAYPGEGISKTTKSSEKKKKSPKNEKILKKAMILQAWECRDCGNIVWLPNKLIFIEKGELINIAQVISIELKPLGP